MTNFILPLQKANQIMRDLRHAGVKLKREQKGIWFIVDAPIFMARPQNGDKIYLSKLYKGEDVYIIPETWLDRNKIQIEWKPLEVNLPYFPEMLYGLSRRDISEQSFKDLFLGHWSIPS